MHACSLRSLKKSTAAATAVLFFFSSILAPVLEASISSPAAAPAVPYTTEELIPHHVGAITAARDFPGARTVFLIQDLHCHPEVQRNISAIIGVLDKKYDLKQVYIEGASGDVNTSCMTPLSGAGLAAPVAQALLDAGRLTGGEYYAITANRPRLLKGLEDSRLHAENIVRLGSLLAQKESLATSAALLDKDLALLKNRYLNRRNRKLNELIADYSSRRVSARKYYAILHKYAEQVNSRPRSFNAALAIQMERYPNVEAYRELLALEQRLNYSRIKRQMGAFLGDLKTILPYSVYSDLLQDTDRFGDAEKLVSALRVVVEDRHIPLMPRYPDLAVFLRYHTLGRSVNPVELIREEKQLVDELRIAFSRDVSEVEVSFLCDFHDVFKDYLFNRLSAADYGYFVSRFKKFKALWAKYNYTNHLAGLEPVFPLLDAYYAANNRRSEEFVTRTLNGPAAPPVIVMVTGGFHAEDIQKLLEERRISYRTVTPRIHTDTAGAGIAYESIIREQAALFSRTALSYRPFMQMAPEILPTDDGYILRFKTGEYVRVSRDGKNVTLTSVSPEKVVSTPHEWQSLTNAAAYGAGRAAALARSHLGLFATVLSGPDIVPFTGMLYFLARKGWLAGDGLSIDIEQSSGEDAAVVLQFLARAIDKKTADLNDLAVLPELAQDAILTRVNAMRDVDRSTPAYIKAIDELYELLIRINSGLEYESTKNPKTFAANHPAIAPRTAAALMTRVLAWTSFSRPLNTALHSLWNRRFWGTGRMLSAQEALQIPLSRPMAEKINGYDIAFSLDRRFVQAGMDTQDDYSGRMNSLNVVEHDMLMIPASFSSVSNGSKTNLMGMFEHRQNLLALNESVLTFMNASIDEGFTRADARRLLAMLRAMADIYLRLVPNMTRNINETFDRIEKTLSASWGSFADGEQLLTDAERKIVADLSFSPQYAYEIRSLHQMLNYLHQQGLRSFDRMAAAIDPGAGQSMVFRGTNIAGQDVPLIVANIGDAPLVADGRVTSRALRVIARAMARTAYNAANNDDLYDPTNPIQPPRALFKDTFVSYSHQVGYHSMDISAELAMPDAGGYVRVSFADAGTFAYGSEKRLESMKMILERAGMSVTINKDHLTAVLDQNHGAVNRAHLEYALFIAIRLSWFTRWVDNAFENNNVPALNNIREDVLVSELFSAEETIPFGIHTADARKNWEAYVDRKRQRDTLRQSLNSMLEFLGLHTIPDAEPFGQRLINEYYNEQIRAALARGEVRIASDGALERASGYAPVDALLSALSDDDTRDAAVRMGGVISRLVDPLEFETIGSIGGLVCGQAQMELMGGGWLVVTGLINPRTGRVLYAQGFTNTDETAQPRLLDARGLEALFKTEYLLLTDDREDAADLAAWGAALLRAPPAVRADAGGAILRAEVVSPGSESIVAGTVVFEHTPSIDNPVFIAPYTTPDDIDAIRNAGAVITTGGGTLSHMGITTRELGVPGVIVKGASWLKDPQGKRYLRLTVQRPGNPVMKDGYWVSDTAEAKVIDIHEGDRILVDTANGEVAVFTVDRRGQDVQEALAARRAARSTTQPAANLERARPQLAREAAPARTAGELVYRLSDIDDSYIEIAGGKSAMLGAMGNTVRENGGTVPEGIAVTTLAFEQYLNEADPSGTFKNLIAELEKMVSSGASESAIHAQSERVRGWLKSHPITQESTTGMAILGALARHGLTEKQYAVRSSAVQEDTSEAAFAGAAQTYLYVTRQQVLEKVNECWQSFWLPRGVSYRAAQGMGQSVNPAVTIQAMVDAEVSGVIFTRDPVTGAEATVIEAAYGLGEGIVGGLVEPDEYRVPRDGWQEEPKIGAKAGKVVRSADGTTIVPLHTDPSQQRKLQRQRALSGEQVSDLNKLARALEEQFGYPLDIEFSIRDGKIYILQARPLTGASVRAIQKDNDEDAISELLARKLYSATAVANRFVADVDLPGIGTITPVNALRGANLVVVGYQGRAPPPEYISVDAARNEIGLRYDGLSQFTDQEIGLKLLHATIMLAAQQAARAQAIPWTPELSESVSQRADEIIKNFEQTARIDAARAIDVTRQGFVALSSRDAAGTIFDLDDGSARGTIYEGQGAVAYLRSMSGKPFPHETAIVVLEGSSISVGDQLVDHEGAVYIPQGGSVRLHDFTGPLYVIQMTQVPLWYETKRFTREAFPQVWEQINGFNATGIVYKNHTGVTVFKLSERRNVWTGESTEWLLDSVSGDEQSIVGPSFGISMVNYEMGDGADFHLMRPAEWLHNHPSHGDASMTEIYMCLSGTMEVAVFRDDRWYVNKLTPGKIMIMRPNIDHAVIKGGGHYKHIAIQFPSTFQYGFDFSNKHTPLPVLHANVPSLYNALWRVESNGLNYLGVHPDSSVPIADKQAPTEFRWRVRTANPSHGSGFALAMGVSVARALEMRPRLRRIHKSLPSTGKAVVEALVSVFAVPFIEADDIAGALASDSARESFLLAHDDASRSQQFRAVAARMRRIGLRMIGVAVHSATPFGPTAARWANISTHMMFNALAVPAGMALSRGGRFGSGTLKDYVSESGIGAHVPDATLSAEEVIALLRNHARGVWTAQEFLSKHYGDVAGGYYLGLSSFGHRRYWNDLLSGVLGAAQWDTAYKEFGIYKFGNTEAFMDAVTNSGKPIVFFVPAQLHEDTETLREIAWLLQRPGRMKNIHFVFGDLKDYFPRYIARLFDEAWPRGQIYPEEALEYIIDQAADGADSAGLQNLSREDLRALFAGHRYEVGERNRVIDAQRDAGSREYNEWLLQELHVNRWKIFREHLPLIQEYLDRIRARLNVYYKGVDTPVTFKSGKNNFFGVGSVRFYFEPVKNARNAEAGHHRLFVDAHVRHGEAASVERIQGVATGVSTKKNQIVVVDMQGRTRTIEMSDIVKREGSNLLALTINTFSVPAGYTETALAEFMATESDQRENKYLLEGEIREFNAKLQVWYDSALRLDLPKLMIHASGSGFFLEITLKDSNEDMARVEEFASPYHLRSAILPKNRSGALKIARAGDDGPVKAARWVVAQERFWRSIPILNLVFPLMHIPAGRAAVFGSAMVVASAYLPAALLAGAVSSVCAVPAVIAAAIVGYGIGIWAAGKVHQEMDARYLRRQSGDTRPASHVSGLFRVINAMRLVAQDPGNLAGTRLTLRDFFSLANEYVVNQIASTRAGDRFLQWLANRRHQHRSATLPAAIESIREKINNNEPVAIVTVCTANKNRSVLMDFLLRAWLEKKGKKNVTVRSAGLLVNLLDNAGAPLSPNLRSVLMHPSSEFGVDGFFDDFTTEQFTAEHAKADLFLVASEQHKKILMKKYNVRSEKILMFTDLSPGLSTAFPYGMPDPDRLPAPRILVIANVVKLAIEQFFSSAAQQRAQSSTGSAEEPPDVFSAIDLHFTRFLQAAGIGLDVPAAELATAIVEQITAGGKHVARTESRRVRRLQSLLERYLAEKRIPGSVKVVVTTGGDAFVKYANAICGIPSFLHRAEDGSVTLYIHQGFLEALFAQNSTLRDEIRPGLPRGSLVELFVRDEVEEFIAVRNMITQQNIAPSAAYVRHHAPAAHKKFAHHPLIVELARRAGLSALGLDGIYVPATIQPDIVPMDENSEADADPAFVVKYFDGNAEREALSYFAQRMWYDQIVFVDPEMLDETARADGYAIVGYDHKKTRRKIVPAKKILIANNITFVQLVNLLSVLYKRMLADSDTKGAAYKKILRNQITDLDRVVKQFIYAADYLEDVQKQWPARLGLTDQQAAMLAESLAPLIAGFRTVAEGYHIGVPDSAERRKAMAESLLAVDEGWLMGFLARVPAEDRGSMLLKLINAERPRWKQRIDYELRMPARELYAAVMEQGGRHLDEIRSKTDPLTTLRQEIDEDMTGFEPGTAPYEEQVLKVVQQRVNRYFDRKLYSEDPETFSEELIDFARQQGVRPEVGLFSNTISIPIVLESLHMVCVMQSYLCGRLLQERGIPVYWLHVEETVGGRRLGHAALLARPTGGLYQIVDAIYPSGAGYISSVLLAPGEVEQRLSTSVMFSKALDKDSASRHHEITITDFESGSLNSFLTTVGWVALKRAQQGVAGALLRDATVVNPDFFLPWAILGSLYYEQSRYSESRTAWSMALRLKPGYKEAENMLQQLGPPAILPANAGPYLLTVAALRRFMPVRWARVIGLAIVHAKEYSWLKPLMDERAAGSAAAAFDAAHGAPSDARRSAILAMGEAGRRAGRHVRWTGLSPLAQFIASGIAHVRYDLTATLPMAVIVAEDGAVEQDTSAATAKGYVPLVVRRLSADTPGLRRGGRKGVWVTTENGVLTAHLAVNESKGETFAGRAADYIGALKGYGQVQGAQGLVKALEHTGGHRLNTRALAVVSGIRLALPTWQDIVVKTSGASLAAWDVESNVRHAQRYAAAPEIGLISRWSPALAEIPQFNRSLVLTPAELNKAGTDNVRLLQGRGARVYALYDGSNADEARTLIQEFGLNGLIGTNEALPAESITPANSDTVVASPAGRGKAVRVLEEINLSDPMVAKRIKQIRPGSVVRVRLGGQAVNEEQLAALTGLSPSTILILESDEVKKEGVTRDITEIMFCGVNLLSLLALTPQTPEEKQRYQRAVAYGLEIGTFEQYADEAAMERDIAAMESGTVPAHNRKFAQAVRLHLDGVNDTALGTEFLAAAAQRLRARQSLAEAGKRNDLENPALEQLFGEMLGKNVQYKPSETILRHYADLSSDRRESHESFGVKLFNEIQALRTRAEQNNDPEAISTIIELIKLYAGERLYATLSDRDTALVRTDAARAILEAA